MNASASELIERALAAYVAAAPTLPPDTQAVVSLLATALGDAVAGRLRAMTLAMDDEDAATYVYRWLATEPPAVHPAVWAVQARVQ